MAAFLEPHGASIWLGCVVLCGVAVLALWRSGSLARFKFPVLAAAVVLITPLVYVGHPFIFAPLWIYAFNGRAAILSLVLVWSLLFGAAILVAFFLRRTGH